MQRLEIRCEELKWQQPLDHGKRTPCHVLKGVCRHKVMTQIREYIQRGYLREASVSESLFLSPLLPIEKQDGSYRFVNDYRALNAHFVCDGMEQESMWQKLWEVKRSWSVFMRLDLKDAYFSVPLEEPLQAMFAFHGSLSDLSGLDSRRVSSGLEIYSRRGSARSCGGLIQYSTSMTYS